MSDIKNLQNKLLERTTALVQARNAGDLELQEEIQDEIWELEEEIEGVLLDEYDDKHSAQWR